MNNRIKFGKIVGISLVCIVFIYYAKLNLVKWKFKHEIELNYSISEYQKSKKASTGIIQDLNKQQQIKDIQINFADSQIQVLQKANYLIKLKYEKERKRYINNDSMLLLISDSILSSHRLGKVSFNK